MASQYDIQRQRIASESAAQSQSQNDALKRRFARMGGLNSGSYLKASERLAGQQEQNKQKALEGVDVQEAAAREQREEAERGRQFSREERLGSQEFAAGESALGRRFVSSEREAGQSFAKGEREAGQAFADTQAAKGFERQAALQKEQIANQNAQFSQQMDQRKEEFAQNYAQQREQFGQQMGMANRQFALDEEVSRFNMDMAERIFNQKDFFEKAVDPFGGIDRSYEKGHSAMGKSGELNDMGSPIGFARVMTRV